MASSSSSAASYLLRSVSTGSMITVTSPTSGGGGGAGSPCAACKFLRRKCQPDCVFAPYFPPDNPHKFVQVHRVFGASNVTKILNELQPCQREDAVNSLAYEADMRLRDPVYGCVGVISILQHRLRQLQQELDHASFELSKYQQAAAAAAVVSSGGPAPLTGFAGNMLPDSTQNIMNTGHQSMAAAIGGSAGFMQHDNFATVQMLARSYDGEAATARVVGVNGGGSYEFGSSSALGGEHSGRLGQTSGAPFLKPGTARRDGQSTSAQ